MCYICNYLLKNEQLKLTENDMTEKTLSTCVREFRLDELDADRRALVEKAREATKGSYAPYSHFNVGAALLLDNGMIIKGANQENAAFGAGTCGERSAIFNAGANYPGVAIKRLAVTAFTNGDFVEEPCAPCGVCRQAILEYETQSGKPIEMLLCGRDRVLVIDSVADLLPLCFKEF